jgi:hypothetical protein
VPWPGTKQNRLPASSPLITDSQWATVTPLSEESYFWSGCTMFISCTTGGGDSVFESPDIVDERQPSKVTPAIKSNPTNAATR